MDTSAVMKSLPLHIQVYNYFREQIIYGKIAGGKKIVESKLSQELNISRSPVREAMRLLLADELLINYEGGIIVNPMNYQSSLNVYESRIALEPFAARLAAKRMSEPELSELKKCVDFARTWDPKDENRDDVKIIENNSRFHALIAHSCQNHYLQGYLDKNLGLMSLVRNNEFFNFPHDNGFVIEHSDVYEAIRERNEEKAEEAMRKHVTADYRTFIRNNLNKAQVPCD